MDSLAYTIWLIIAIITAIEIYNYFTRNHDYWSTRGINGPKHVIAFGTSSGERYGQKTRLIRKYGKIYGVFFGNTPVLTVAEPKLINDIMVKNFDCFVDKAEEHLSAVRNRNVSVIAGAEWKPFRTIISRVFTSRNIRRMCPKMWRSVHLLTNALKMHAKSGVELDLRPQLEHFAGNVTANCIFNMNINAHIDGNGRCLADNSNQVMLEMNWLFNLAKLFIPTPWLKPALHLGIEYDYKVQYLMNTCKRLMAERREWRYSDDEPVDYIRLMVELILTKTTGLDLNDCAQEFSAYELNLDISADDIGINYWVLLIAANFMITNTLSAIVYELAVNEQKQQKLCEELTQFYETHDECDSDLLTALPYLEAVVAEGARLHVASNVIDRIAAHDYTLPSGVVIPKGHVIQIPIYAMHNSDDNFPNAGAFIPERFLPEHKSSITANTYMPFGVGPRNCPAQRFALNALMICVSQLVRKYRFYRTSGTDIPMKVTKHKPFYVPARCVVGITDRVLENN